MAKAQDMEDQPVPQRQEARLTRAALCWTLLLAIGIIPLACLIFLGTPAVHDNAIIAMVAFVAVFAAIGIGGFFLALHRSRSPTARLPLLDDEFDVSSHGAERPTSRPISLTSFLHSAQGSPWRTTRTRSNLSGPAQTAERSITQDDESHPIATQNKPAQFEIEPGSRRRIRGFHLRRLGSTKVDSANRPKPPRRKLSKRSLGSAANVTSHRGSARLPVEGIGQSASASHGSGPSTTTLAQSAIGPDPETLALLPTSIPAPEPAKLNQSAGGFTRSRSYNIAVSDSAVTFRPLLHRRSFSHGAMLPQPSPAPVGPLPPLPTAAVLAQKALQTAKQGRAGRRPRSTPGSDTAIRPISVASNHSGPAQWCATPRSVATPRDAQSAHSQTVSINTWRSSIPLPSAALEEAGVDHLSPESTKNQGAGSGGMAALADDSEIIPSQTVWSKTPRKRQASRVSLTGSPAQRRRELAHTDGAVDSLLSMDMTPATKDLLDNKLELQALSPTRPPSILKGSPNARKKKGHRRQNCVRISIPRPTTISAGTSQVSLAGIVEESPSDSVGIMIPRSSRSRKHFEPRISLSPSNFHDPQKWRASLTPSSPTLSLSRFQQDCQTSARPHLRSMPPAVLESPEADDMMSIDCETKFDFTTVPLDDGLTPTVEITRPSGEHDRPASDFPFPRIVHDASKPAVVDDRELCWSPPTEEFDDYNPAWVPFPLGQSVWADDSPGFDKADWRLSDSSSESLDFPYPDGNVGACSDPLDEMSTMHTIDVPPPLSTTARQDPSGRQTPVRSIPQPWTTSPQPPQTYTESPLSAHPPTAEVPSRQSAQPKHFENRRSVIFSSSGNASQPVLLVRSQPDTMRSPSIVSAQPLQGPRAPPADPILRSIMNLRRMDSDVKLAGPLSRGSRRWRNLGREDSLHLPFDSSRFSIYSDAAFDDGQSLISAFDDVALDPVQESAQGVAADHGTSGDEVEAKPPLGSVDITFTFPESSRPNSTAAAAPPAWSPLAAAARVLREDTAAGNRRSDTIRLVKAERLSNSSLVWELGEGAWPPSPSQRQHQKKSKANVAGKSPSRAPPPPPPPRRTTPPKNAKLEKVARMSAAAKRESAALVSPSPVARPRTPVVVRTGVAATRTTATPTMLKRFSDAIVAAVAATPASLYDATGFLKDDTKGFIKV